MTHTPAPHLSIPGLVTSPAWSVRRRLGTCAPGRLRHRRTLPSGAAGGTASSAGPLPISAIPDQDPEVLNRLYGDVAARFADATGLDVTYTSVTEYSAVVPGFEVGDIAIA